LVTYDSMSKMAAPGLSLREGAIRGLRYGRGYARERLVIIIIMGKHISLALSLFSSYMPSYK